MIGFRSILGQEAAHAQLRAGARSGRLPHALLFHGTRGVGKTATAFALARFVLCAQPQDDDACGECRSCRLTGRFQHPDVHWIFPMEGSRKGSARIQHIRDSLDERVEPGIHRLEYAAAATIAIGRDDDTRPGSVAELRHEAQMTAVEGGFRVFVVTDAEIMRNEAANSLLKILEEPPPGNLLILTTQRPGAILETIRSRCQSVRFRDLPEETIVEVLRERWTPAPKGKRRKKKDAEAEPAPLDPQAARLAAALGRGSVSKAGEILREAGDGADVVSLRDRAIRILGLRPGEFAVHEVVQELAPGGRTSRTPVANLIDFGLVWASDLLRAATGSDVPLANRDREDRIREEARHLSVGEIRRRVTVLEEARAALFGNVYLPLVLYQAIYGWNGHDLEPDARALLEAGTTAGAPS